MDVSVLEGTAVGRGIRSLPMPIPYPPTRFLYWPSVCYYTRAMSGTTEQCAVLAYCMLLRARYAVSGTDLGYAPTAWQRGRG
eukprot:3940989-Rhodomonas_salina.1